MAQKRRRSILSQVKGYRFDRSKKKRAAREAIYHAQLHSFAHRKQKKTLFRQLWIVRLNAALRTHSLSYSRFIKMLSTKNIGLNRKMLALIAKERPAAFERIVRQIT